MRWISQISEKYGIAVCYSITSAAIKRTNEVVEELLRKFIQPQSLGMKYVNNWSRCIMRSLLQCYISMLQFMDKKKRYSPVFPFINILFIHIIMATSTSHDHFSIIWAIAPQPCFWSQFKPYRRDNQMFADLINKQFKDGCLLVPQGAYSN
ncbi:hypothetical protein TSUD_306390 [Trifolium subterraneum]|uniref:Uncharacterized protein n=1 Tax=Trifolium subterraneum TaxID=3900 RepID=A0A2Z6NUB5_TRISU|nr:hypothetical protein TSUD_306390 [Trifolium subterraneum]